uniref:Uncharacterized protein n=1 Tax=Romanomermis culicivorax TaxID=13658 RepID=A0A915HJU1_ROMCU
MPCTTSVVSHRMPMSRNAEDLTHCTTLPRTRPGTRHDELDKSFALPVVSSTTSKQKGSDSSAISQKAEIKMDPVSAPDPAAPTMTKINSNNNMAVGKELLTADDRDAQIDAPIDRRPKLAKN